MEVLLQFIERNKKLLKTVGTILSLPSGIALAYFSLYDGIQSHPFSEVLPLLIIFAIPLILSLLWMSYARDADRPPYDYRFSKSVRVASMALSFLIALGVCFSYLLYVHRVNSIERIHFVGLSDHSDATAR